MLRVRLLGRMEVEAGGTLVTPPHSRRAWSLLADLDDDWVLVARDEHADRQAAVLAALAVAADTPVEAVAWARRRLAVNPLDEEAARDLMRRLAAAGEPAAALIVCERLRARLRRALGVAPSEQTRALAERLRRAAAVPT